MDTVPIQITDEGILIPKMYLDTTRELELFVTDDFIVIRHKPIESESGVVDDAPPYDYPFIGIGQTRAPHASINVDEILETEIKRDSGLSLDSRKFLSAP